jgi:hypothetical protein
MNKRPISITLISLLLAAAGAVGFVYHLRELNVQHPFQNDFMWIEAVRLLAVIGGVFMLRGQNWARWLAVIWLGFHVATGAIHSLEQFAFHAVLFAMIAYILFRRPEADYFRGGRAEASI